GACLLDIDGLILGDDVDPGVAGRERDGLAGRVHEADDRRLVWPAPGAVVLDTAGEHHRVAGPGHRGHRNRGAAGGIGDLAGVHLDPHDNHVHYPDLNGGIREVRLAVLEPEVRGGRGVVLVLDLRTEL